MSAIGLFAHCSGNANNNDQGNKKTQDSPTIGQIYISVDETYKPIIDSQIEVFNTLYQRAKITPVYKPEADVARDLLNDTMRVVIMPQQLTPYHKAFFDSVKYQPRITRVALDAVAFIMHPSNPDSALLAQQVESIFNGTYKTWNQISGNGSNKPIKIVFDSDKSSTLRYVKDSIARGNLYTQNTFATQTNPEVIEFVAKNPDTFGIIGVNWISSMDDPKVQKFRKDVNVVAIAKPGTAKFVEPYQAYIATRDYPYCRFLYILNAQTYAGLGLGFAAFLAEQRGQLIFQKSGLMPVTMPTRVYSLTKEQI
ncbi:MAG: substrate-binding domain-containing protein [Chitinophagales bacterium]|nr:substrate-binding domain-containing protein [Sphingobacteriales bacterium]MBP9140358.1 substrate-binding domain-containing protein [Chitinophagales bacterium]MDA0199573.1 substrate-binding domain-containing protein [Bacteroidota bacterium]MBK6890046.1 substrate-binding domain-containing protein [Sphingobacteriales bacterium]MBL0248892.1 substrate-binding domain-containing protein [Sphingobacteriales bacterium]